ncbi:hypothetical protein RP20_CCG014334 [Aedes albopictus]|nr:hypothetical protein RP20_CCG014334 [Aedes albopictus]
MYHRIQKLLLLGEYRHQRSTSRSDPDQQQQQQVDLEDGAEDSVRILIESPFAQVDRCGQGIRAVQLGLSAAGWLFVAVDDFVANPPHCDGDVWWRPPCHDSEVDCLELLCALPLRFVRLKVERHRGGREVLRATLVTGRRLYFEFGGDGLLRPLLVNTWRDRIQELRCKKYGKDKINDCEAEETIVAPDGSSSRSGDESLLGKLPEHLRLFFERERQRRRPHDGCSSGGGGISSSKASTDVESCIYEWDRRHRTKEKRRLAKRMASILARNNEEEIPSPWL